MENEEIVNEITVQGRVYKALKGETIQGVMRYFAYGPKMGMYVIWIDDEFTKVRSIQTGKTVLDWTKNTTIKSI